MVIFSYYHWPERVHGTNQIDVTSTRSRGRNSFIASLSNYLAAFPFNCQFEELQSMLVSTIQTCCSKFPALLFNGSHVHTLTYNHNHEKVVMFLSQRLHRTKNILSFFLFNTKARSGSRTIIRDNAS